MENLFIFLHGIKGPEKNQNNWTEFLNYANSKKIIFEFLNFDYYDNFYKPSLKYKEFDKLIDNIINENKDRKIILVGYSLGCCAAVKMMAKYDNINTAILFLPPFKIAFFKWFNHWLKGLKIKKNIKKKLGKQRYKNMKKSSKENKINNKYPATMIWEAYKYVLHCRKYLREIKNKKIFINFSKVDPTLLIKKNQKYLEKNLDFKSNKINIKYTDHHHYSYISKNSTDIFDQLIKSINEENN